MQKFFNKFLTFGLSIAVLFGLVTVTVPAAEPYTAVEASAAESTYTGTYYDSITETSGTALLGQIHDLITSTHKTYPTYKGLNSIFPQSDPGLDGKGVLEFYTHETLTGDFGSSTGNPNKEHVWPKSLSNGLWKETASGYKGGGADLHHIRPTEMTLNSKRGNDKYGNLDKNSAEEAYSKKVGGGQSELGGYSGGGVFMPLDNVKGDVARIVMYVYTHYNTYNSSVFGGYASTNGSGSVSFGTLKFTDVIKASSESAAISLLLDWNKSDPIDDIERTRNNVAFEEQGNRNPFIDNEDYADAIWGDGTLGDPVTPTSLSLTPAEATVEAGKTQVLTLSAQPADATKSVTWKSDNEAVATVSNGTVTGRGVGVAHITATSTLDSNVKAEATITVTPGDVFTPLTEAKAGTYYLGMDVDGTYYFAKNNFVNDYYIETTTDISQASQYTITQQGSGWIIKQGSSFLEIEFNGTHVNPKLNASQTSGKTWAWDPTNKVFTWTDGTNTGFLGNYGSHTNLSGAMMSYIDQDYRAVFGTYTKGGGEDGGDGGDHTHTYAYEPSDETYHIKTCTGCDEVHEQEKHVYTNDRDMTCNLCGYSRAGGSQGGDSQGGGQGGGEQTENVAAFHTAVEGIVTQGLLTARFASINRAVTAYKALTAAEKEAAREDVQRLQTAIEEYNRYAEACNAEADEASKGALGGASGLLKAKD